MTEILQVKQAREKSTFDIEYVGKEIVGICELKMRGGTVSCYWWLSGLTMSGNASLILQLQTSLPAKTQKVALEQAEELLRPLLRVAKVSLAGSGLKADLLLPELSKRKAFAIAHLRLMDSVGLLGKEVDGIYVRTSRQYQLCESLGVTNVVETISEFEAVPLSTVRKRIQRSREAGILERKREQEQANE
jgi:hypothetical protein